MIEYQLPHQSRRLCWISEGNRIGYVAKGQKEEGRTETIHSTKQHVADIHKGKKGQKEEGRTGTVHIHRAACAYVRCSLVSQWSQQTYKPYTIGRFKAVSR